MADAIDDILGFGSTASSGLPGVGTAISSGLGIGQGVLNLLKSNREQKKAQGLRPPMEDPEMRGYLSYLERKRRSIETGTAYGRQASEISSQLANTQSGIASASGGNAGAAILGMTRAQRGAGDAFGNLVQGGAPLIASYEGNIGRVLQDMADRRLNAQNRDYEQALGESAILQKSGQEAIMGGVARLLPMAFPKRNQSANAVPLNSSVTPSASADVTPGFPVDWSNPYGGPRMENNTTIPLDENNLPLRGSTIPMESY